MVHSRKIMKNIIFAIIIFFIVINSCLNRKDNDRINNSEETILSSDDIEDCEVDVDIEVFKQQCDSLLKEWKNEKYYFELKSDTFNFVTDDREKFQYGHGWFSVLYRDTTNLVVRHYMFAPNTKKCFEFIW